MKLGRSASPKATALAAITCISGPPCRPGNTAELIFLASLLVVGQDHAAARAAQRLVRRGGHDMGVRERDGMRAAGDQPGEMRHVDHQIGADLVGDLAEARGNR